MKITECFVELFPRVCVFDGQTQTSLCRTGATRAECCAPEIENRQRDFEAFAWRPEDVFLWNFDIAQRESASRRAPDSHLRHPGLEHFEAGHVRCDQKCCDCSLVRSG